VEHDIGREQAFARVGEAGVDESSDLSDQVEIRLLQ